MIRNIACNVGVSAPESDEDIYSHSFLSGINRAIKRCFSALEVASDRIEMLEKSIAFKRYTTTPAESLAGIALRELGSESLWTHIAQLNAHHFPEMKASDYYPVGTELILPNINIK